MDERKSLPITYYYINSTRVEIDWVNPFASSAAAGVGCMKKKVRERGGGARLTTLCARARGYEYSARVCSALSLRARHKILMTRASDSVAFSARDDDRYHIYFIPSKREREGESLLLRSIYTQTPIYHVHSA